VYEQEVDGLLAAMSELGALGAETDLPALRSELSQIIGRFLVLPRSQFPLGEVLMATLRTMWLHHARVPAELSLTAKSLLLAEAVAGELDPDFDLRVIAEPVLEAARSQELMASAIVARATRATARAARHLSYLPERLDRILGMLEQGDLRLRTEENEADQRWGRLGRVVNRLGVSILAASLLLAGALLLVSQSHPTHVGLGTGAIIGAIVLGLAVLLRYLRPGQM
jgi:ubiquinone biosynthesis protein